jgi:hypothetical protein
LSRRYAIETIRNFLNGTPDGWWDWDVFISIPLGYPDLEELQRFCNSLSFAHPAREKNHYCSEEGFRPLRARLEELEKDIDPA